jgi:cell division protein ZapA
MNNNLLNIDKLGSSFTIRSSEDPEYLEQVVWYLENKIKDTQKKVPVTDPLKIAILSGFFLVDELMKEKMKKGLPYSITAQDADEIGKITEDLIELIDRNI